MRIDLDSGGRHYLLVESAADGSLRISLHHSSSQRRSVLHNAFRRHLRLRIDGTDCAFAADSDELVLPPTAAEIEVMLGNADPHRMARLRLAPTMALDAEPYVLSPFESRYLADNGYPHPVVRTHSTPSPLRTDLHVHFAGCVSPKDLVDIGAKCQVRYPAALLAEVGIHIEGADDASLADLPPAFLRQLEERLAIPLDHQVAFIDMEKVYRLRSPITKSPATFLPLCRRIAADYREMGVTYAELSLSNVIEAERLRIIHRELPAIEREFGVDLRFLAALNRHDDLEWDLDCIDRIEALLSSRYMVGVDFMGHENNSTHDFSLQLREAAQRFGRARPGFVVRVHAGENPANPENVRVALDCVEGTGVQFRIGHGLFGVDDATLDRLRASNAIVEFNLNSNFALNNIQNSAGAPIRRYVRHGVPVVLGTDGYGIYQTDASLEARAAALCGLEEPDFAHIRATEADYLHKRAASDAALPEAAAFVVPDEAPLRHYTPEVMARKAAAQRQRDQTLLDRLSTIGVPLLDAAAVESLLRGKTCISFAGAWRTSWERVSPDNRAIIRREMEKLLATLSPEQTILITGGTEFGVEGVVQELAMPRGFKVLGTLVAATPPESLHPGAITHAYLVGKTLYDKAAGLYRLMKNCNGLCLFIGGGSIVNDEIQTASNLRLRYLLMDGPEGASTIQARQQPDHAFRFAAEIAEVLSAAAPWSSTDEPYWHLGANPTVDIVLTRLAPRTGQTQVLLIQRDVDAPTEGGKWALPGGFQLTDAPRGTPWRRTVESARDACVRELLEETSLDILNLADALLHIGNYEGGGRDPRDTAHAWSRSEVFALHLPPALAGSPLCGADDACDARWFDVTSLPPNLAFDHARILRDGLARLNKNSSEGRD